MKTQVIVFNVSHYNMGENKGLSLQIEGDIVASNNKFGRDISYAEVGNYNELSVLSGLSPDSFPAKFECDLGFKTVKDKNGKEKTGVTLSNLKFLESLELVSKKAAISK
ncbi:hypothetical protein [Schinkia azotoformans]|uniref:hypothetical protein n=1 Tax=Schinkia azotoformans TaxID=1454 RepID=UPI003D2CB2A6